MSGHALLTVWSDSVMLSGLVWLAIALMLLYLARRPAHAAVLATGRTLHRLLRLSARSVLVLEARLARRNRQVLRAQAIERQQRQMDTAFRRVGDAVARDLSDYPALHRALSEQIVRIDEDYRRAIEVPPAPPAWLEAVDAVANIPAKDDPAVNQILGDIHATLERACHNTITEYRAASHRRHKLLRRMLPYWRCLRETLDRVDRNIAGIEARSRRIDEHMARYEALRAEGEPVERVLRGAALTRFLVSAALLGVAVLAGFLDYTLIARPMAELTGGLGGSGPTGLAGFTLAQVAAATLVLLQVCLGLALMELLGVTRLFPAAGDWPARRRKAAAAAATVALVLSAALVAGFAFQRDYLVAQDMALTGFPSIDPAQPPQMPLPWLPALAQMFLGLLLPVVLAVSAIPLETFLQSGRSVLGDVLSVTLRLLAYLLRLAGQLADALAGLLTRVYDLLIFLPLAVETWLRGALQRGSGTDPQVPAAAPATTSANGSRRRRKAAAKTTQDPVEDGGDRDSGAPEAQT